MNRLKSRIEQLEQTASPDFNILIVSIGGEEDDAEDGISSASLWNNNARVLVSGTQGESRDDFIARASNEIGEKAGPEAETAFLENIAGRGGKVVQIGGNLEIRFPGGEAFVP